MVKEGLQEVMRRKMEGSMVTHAALIGMKKEVEDVIEEAEMKEQEALIKEDVTKGHECCDVIGAPTVTKQEDMMHDSVMQGQEDGMCQVVKHTLMRKDMVSEGRDVRPKVEVKEGIVPLAEVPGNIVGSSHRRKVVHVDVGKDHSSMALVNDDGSDATRALTMELYVPTKRPRNHVDVDGDGDVDGASGGGGGGNDGGVARCGGGVSACSDGPLCDNSQRTPQRAPMPSGMALSVSCIPGTPEG